MLWYKGPNLYNLQTRKNIRKMIKTYIFFSLNEKTLKGFKYA